MKKMNMKYSNTEGQVVELEVSSNDNSWIGELKEPQLETSEGIEKILGHVENISFIEELSFVTESGETINIE